MTHIAAPGDTIRITAEDVTLLDGSFARQPQTSGVTGTVQLEEWDSGSAEGSPYVITLHHESDWYVDIDAPETPGRYRVVVVLTVNGAQRTLHSELNVSDPPT